MCVHRYIDSVVVWLLTSLVVCQGMLPEERLMQYLFHNQTYKPHIRPAAHPADIVNVALLMQLVAIHEVNTKDQKISVSGWVLHTWNDVRLTWDPEEFDGIEELVVHSSDVWVPDVTLDNSAGDVYSENQQKYFRVTIYPDGEMAWEPGGQFTSVCNFDITYYPFDHQGCKFVFANWAYTGFTVNLTIGEDAEISMKEGLVDNGEWSVTGVDVSRVDRYYHCCVEPYPEVHFTLFIARKPLFYYINVVCPAVMLGVLVLLVFLLPPDAGEKISMGVTLLLAFSVFLLMVSDNVPNTSLAVPLIQIYLVIFMGVTCLTVILSVIVLYIHHQGAPRAPFWLRRAAFVHISRVLMKKTTYTSSQNDDIIGNGGAKDHVGTSRRESRISHMGKVPSTPPSPTPPPLSLTPPTHITRTQDVADEWKAIARIFDQFFFWLFLFVFLLSSIALLCIMPVFNSAKRPVG